jgi:ABC-type glycerol-3-phosphate transport system permease component
MSAVQTRSQQPAGLTHKRLVVGGHYQSTLEVVAIYTQLILGACVLLIPFFWMLSTSLKPLDEVYVYPIKWIPSRLVWQNYVEVFTKSPFGRFILNTAYLTVMGIIGSLFGSSLAAFSFSRLRFRGKNFLFLLMLSTMMVPGWVTMIPTFIVFKSLGWLNSYKPLLVPAFFASPFYTFLLRQFFLGVPVELEDAARIDGCSTLRIFLQIMLPLARPALGTVAIFAFFHYWNELLGPLIYLQTQDKLTISVGILSFKSEQYANFANMMAAACISMAPCLLLFFLAQRMFIQGVVITGVKG